MELIDKKCLVDNNLTEEQSHNINLADPNVNKCAILCFLVAQGYLDGNGNSAHREVNIRNRFSCEVNETIEDKCEKGYQFGLCLSKSIERSPKVSLYVTN